MDARLRRALPKLAATAALAAALGAALLLTRQPDEEAVHAAHGHHLGELRAEGIERQQRGDLAGALDKYREAARLAERNGAKLALAENRVAIATVHMTEGRYEEAAGELRQALAAAREADNRIEAATALAYLGQVHRMQGRSDVAMSALREALDLAGDTPSHALALATFQVGELQRSRGDHAAALAAYCETLAALRAMEDRPGQAAILISIGRTQGALGDARAAARSLAQARDLLRRLGYAQRVADVEGEIAALEARR